MKATVKITMKNENVYIFSTTFKFVCEVYGRIDGYLVLKNIKENELKSIEIKLENELKLED